MVPGLVSDTVVPASGPAPLTVQFSAAGSTDPDGSIASFFWQFGDGGTSTGAFHEGLNMASIWDLPLVYVCENNQYGMGTSVARASATTNLSQRGRSFDLPGEQIDGMDVRAVRAAGGRMFLQLWHVGRISHPSLQPDGALPVVGNGDLTSPQLAVQALADAAAGRLRPVAATRRRLGNDATEPHRIKYKPLTR